MTTTTVDTVGGLMSALRKAKPGDTIKLAPGSYRNLHLQDLHYSGAVTIASANPAAPATLSGLTVVNSSNLTFESIDVRGRGAEVWHYAEVSGSRNIVFNGDTISGSNGSPSADAGGLDIHGSAFVSVLNSCFTAVSTGISESGNSNVTLSGNRFSNIGSDGIDNAGTSDLKISGNLFTGFHPKAGDHPDAIQFWTENTSASARDIQISGNTIERGDGAPVQGVFVQDDSGRLPYLGLSITGNRVIGEGYNGIAVQGSVGAVLTGNVVQPYAGVESWIEVERSSGARLTGNAAGSYFFSGDSGLSASGDTILTAKSARAVAAAPASPPSAGAEVSPAPWRPTAPALASAIAAFAPAPLSGAVHVADAKSVVRLNLAVVQA